jgi:hypothetical protein
MWPASQMSLSTRQRRKGGFRDGGVSRLVVEQKWRWDAGFGRRTGLDYGK